MPWCPTLVENAFSSLTFHPHLFSLETTLNIRMRSDPSCFDFWTEINYQVPIELSPRKYCLCFLNHLLFLFEGPHNFIRNRLLYCSIWALSYKLICIKCKKQNIILVVSTLTYQPKGQVKQILQETIISFFNILNLLISTKRVFVDPLIKVF